MRLTDQQRKVIRDACKDVFGSDSVVKLFGSRVDDSLKGGDIDLLVELPSPVEQSGLKCVKLATRIQQRLGDQKIDVMCIWPGSILSSTHKSAIENGVKI